MASSIQGDLNNTAAARDQAEIILDPAYRYKSLAIRPTQDDTSTRQKYRPFIHHNPDITQNDWISRLELSTALKLVDTEIVIPDRERLRVLVLYGSLRKR